MFSTILRAFYALLFRITGWTVIGQSLHHVPKFVMIVAPHTSTWDFFVGIAARSIAEIEYVRFIGKKELFMFPQGILMRAWGGYPVDRSKNNNLVESMVEIFNGKERFAIALAPEGTRNKVKRFRSGFYHIAKKVGIPIVMVGFDFKKKEVVVREPFEPTDDFDADMQLIWNHFKGVTGKNAELGIG